MGWWGGWILMLSGMGKRHTRRFGGVTGDLRHAGALGGAGGWSGRVGARVIHAWLNRPTEDLRAVAAYST